MRSDSKYKPEFVELAYNYLLLGATEAQVAEFFKVTASTIIVWKRQYPEFKEAVETGREVADSKVAKALFRNATGFSYPCERVTAKGELINYQSTREPETLAQIFWLKNRRPDLWRDRVEHSGPAGGAIPVEQMDDKEVARRLAFLLAQGTINKAKETET